MLERISDLSRYSRDEVTNILRAINVKGDLHSQITKSGKKKGRTYSEWKEAYDNRSPELCKTCSGEGFVIPGMRTVGTIHSSSAHACRTRLYYDVSGEIEPIEDLSPETQITFEIGHAIHRFLQKEMHARYGDNFQDEVRVDLPEALILGGSADGVLYLPGLARLLIEIKTISEDQFKALNKPKPEHILQATLYAKALDLPVLCFLYQSKGWPHPMQQFLLPYSESIYTEWWAGKCSFVEESLEKGQPPLPDVPTSACKQCPYSHKCRHAVVASNGFRRR